MSGRFLINKQTNFWSCFLPCFCIFTLYYFDLEWCTLTFLHLPKIFQFLIPLAHFFHKAFPESPKVEKPLYLPRALKPLFSLFTRPLNILCERRPSYIHPVILLGIKYLKNRSSSLTISSVLLHAVHKTGHQKCSVSHFFKKEYSVVTKAMKTLSYYFSFVYHLNQYLSSRYYLKWKR